MCLFEVYLELGASDLAQHALARAKAIETSVGDRRLSVMVLNMESWRLLVEGSPKDAVQSYERALALVPPGAEILAAHVSGWLGLALFAQRRPGDAIVALERALATVTAKGPRSHFTRVLSASRAILDPKFELEASSEPWDVLLASLVQLERSAAATSARALDAARARLNETHASPGSLARLLRRLLTEAIAQRSSAPKLLRIKDGGEAFSRADGPEVRLRGQVLVRAVLMALVEAHARGEGVGIPELFATAWPGEKASAQSVDERVRAVIKRLRRAGLEDLIEAHRGGFRISPSAIVEKASSE